MFMKNQYPAALLATLLALCGTVSAAPVTDDASPGKVICASGHPGNAPEEEIQSTIDGNEKTKWCVHHEDKPVIWEIHLAEALVISNYSLTSANDEPARDPQTWDLLGSNDGKDWTRLDQHKNDPAFSERFQKKKFSFPNSQSFNSYRLVFQPSPSADCFQVAEISLPGAIGRNQALCASGQPPSAPEEDVQFATDGNSQSKWCVNHENRPVIWELRLAKPRAVNHYSLTSANDEPDRDPQTWDFLGSNDGENWTKLDQHKKEPVFSERFQTKKYAFNNTQEYKYYRMAFQPNPNADLLQVAEILIPGVILQSGTSCPSGHSGSAPEEEIEFATDGNTQTKWCVHHENRPVIWELRLLKPQAISHYSLTSANDEPDRDPQTWEFLGSNDGESWTKLDAHKGEPAFSERFQKKDYACDNATAYPYYRLVFQPAASAELFQVAEIAIPGLTPLKAAK